MRRLADALTAVTVLLALATVGLVVAAIWSSGELSQRLSDSSLLAGALTSGVGFVAFIVFKGSGDE